MGSGINPTVPNANAQKLDALITPAKADGVITPGEATRVLASAVEQGVPYAQAQTALRAAGFSGTANLGRDVHTQIAADTTQAQQTLAMLDYKPGEADGRLGTNTAAALRQYQEDQGLPPTGQLDPATKASLTEARNGRSLGWAREQLPQSQHYFDRLAKENPTGFTQQDIARMTPEQADRFGVPSSQLHAAQNIANLERNLASIERGGDTTAAYNSLGSMHEAARMTDVLTGLTTN